MVSLADLSHSYPPPMLDDDEGGAPAGGMTSTKFNFAFFFFGLINNVLYVVILSAALDLVDTNSTPKGLILLVNIMPALLVKLGWPYFVTGEVRYQKRIVSCSAISFVGILVVALSSSLRFRLLGIGIASFSSGLGEMTYLQLSTVYGALPWHYDLGGVAIGWFSSGTGAAGLVGAGLWWVLRGLGVRQGLLLCSFLPLCMSLTYFFLLPPFSQFTSVFSAYEALPVFDITDEEEGENAREDEASAAVREAEQAATAVIEISLTTKEKLRLARPLVFKYMMPLFFVYFAEYTINSGVSPTLLFEVPKASETPILAMIIHSLRDYYPLWQLVYQTFVFLSRSSLSLFRLPPLPRALLPLPTVMQLVILSLTAFESSTGAFEAAFGEAGATRLVFLLISAEGLCGGLAYVNVFYRLGTQTEEAKDGSLEGVNGEDKSKERKAAEHQFVVASVGFADTLGIVMASLVASGLEPALCRAQVARGRTLCKEV